MKIPKIWPQIVVVVWMAAVVIVHWMVQPAAGYREVAARFPVVAQAGEYLKPFFYRKYRF